VDDNTNGAGSVAQEQTIVDAIKEQLPEELARREQDERKKSRQYRRTGDPARGVSWYGAKDRLWQARRIDAGVPP